MTAPTNDTGVEPGSTTMRSATPPTRVTRCMKSNTNLPMV